MVSASDAPVGMRYVQPVAAAPRPRRNPIEPSVGLIPQMLRHRRNAPPGYTTAVLDEIDAKAEEFISLLKRHWLPHQKSGFQTIKARVIDTAIKHGVSARNQRILSLDVRQRVIASDLSG